VVWSNFPSLSQVDNTVKTKKNTQRSLAVWFRRWAREAGLYLFTGEIAGISSLKAKVAGQARDG